MLCNNFLGKFIKFHGKINFVQLWNQMQYCCQHAKMLALLTSGSFCNECQHRIWKIQFGYNNFKILPTNKMVLKLFALNFVLLIHCKAFLDLPNDVKAKQAQTFLFALLFWVSLRFSFVLYSCCLCTFHVIQSWVFRLLGDEWWEFV